MNKTLSCLILPTLIFLGSNNLLANDQIRMKEGSGTVYSISYNNRQTFQNAAKRDTKEDMWLCFNNECHDIGYPESSIGVSGNPANAIKSIQNQNWQEEVYLRHTHISLMQVDHKISPPSDRDVVDHPKIKKYFKKRGIDLINEVFDGKGYWTFNTTLRLEDKLRENFKGSFMRDYLKMKNKINSKEISREEKINEFIDEAGKKGVILSYRTLK